MRFRQPRSLRRLGPGNRRRILGDCRPICEETDAFRALRVTPRRARRVLTGCTYARTVADETSGTRGHRLDCLRPLATNPAEASQADPPPSPPARPAAGTTALGQAPDAVAAALVSASASSAMR